MIELEGASQASDIWGFGATLIEMLTGKPPYSEIETNMAVMFRIVEDDMPPLPDNITTECRLFLTACFHRNTDARPTAHQLFAHEWIQSYLALEPVRLFKRILSSEGDYG